MPPRILISACLLGHKVRYDGGALPVQDAHLQAWQRRGWIVPLCPEVAGGFATPRPPAEIQPDRTAEQVLTGQARILEIGGDDVTAGFLRGAQIALDLAQAQACQFALLADGSPSCGSSYIYSGHHDGMRRPGMGVVAAHLRAAGIQVFAPSQIAELAVRLGSAC